MKADRDEVKRRKLELLAEDYGFSVEDLLQHYLIESIVPGICMNRDCDYTCEWEPDQDKGWCELCGTGSVASAYILAGVI